MAGIGGTPLRRIDAYVLADHLDALRMTRRQREGLPASGNTKRLQRAALQALVKRAYRLRHIDTLPDLATFRIKGASKPVRVKSDPLTLAELLRLLEATANPKHLATRRTSAGRGFEDSRTSCGWTRPPSPVATQRHGET